MLVWAEPQRSNAPLHGGECVKQHSRTERNNNPCLSSSRFPPIILASQARDRGGRPQAAELRGGDFPAGDDLRRPARDSVSFGWLGSRQGALHNGRPKTICQPKDQPQETPTSRTSCSIRTAGIIITVATSSEVLTANPVSAGLQGLRKRRRVGKGRPRGERGGRAGRGALRQVAKGQGGSQGVGAGRLDLSGAQAEHHRRRPGVSRHGEILLPASRERERDLGCRGGGLEGRNLPALLRVLAPTPALSLSLLGNYLPSLKKNKLFPTNLAPPPPPPPPPPVKRWTPLLPRRRRRRPMWTTVSCTRRGR